MEISDVWWLQRKAPPYEENHFIAGASHVVNTQHNCSIGSYPVGLSVN
jgi:hypothetical protein